MITLHASKGLAVVAVLTAMSLAGCPRRQVERSDTGPGGGGIDTNSDAYYPPGTDAYSYRPEGGVNPCAPGCRDAEDCGPEGLGNGLDDNCNGRVDEGCMCIPGTVRSCFAGPPDRQNIGACTDGMMRCVEFGWSACSGGISPSPETCDGVDNDCDGNTDNGVAGCVSTVTCPGSEVVPPLATHRLNASRVTINGGLTASSYMWRVECGATHSGDCPTPATPTAATSDVYLTTSGAYRVTLDMRLSNGSNASCSWAVYARGSEGSLRVELDWNKLEESPQVDMDLHLHRWTRNGMDTDYFTDDDCYFANCTPGDDGVPWGLPDSALSNCDSAPRGGGATWRREGACRNPRLDIDTNAGAGGGLFPIPGCDASERDPNAADWCGPENINVDNPVIGQPYRVMVNYYSGGADTNAWVNIYCGGGLRASFGRDDTLRNFRASRNTSSGEDNESWHVADVVFYRTDCGIDCNVYPVGARGGTVTTGPEFGPAWECDYDRSAGTCVR